MTRLLLPFTFGVEMDVLETLVLLASNQRATLIPLSLISLPSTKRKGVRLELIQQSKDFLEAVRKIAARHHVPLEPVEALTPHAAHSILLSVEQLHADAILLATRGTRGSLLDMEMIEQLIESKPCSLFVVSFPPKKSDRWRARVRRRFANVWPQSTGAGEPQEQRARTDQEPVVLPHSGSPLCDSQPKGEESSLDLASLSSTSRMTDPV